MRTKDDILDDARRDITDPTQKSEAALWLEYRKIEIQIDIRDMLSENLAKTEVMDMLVAKLHELGLKI